MPSFSSLSNGSGSATFSSHSRGATIHSLSVPYLTGVGLQLVERLTEAARNIAFSSLSNGSGSATSSLVGEHIGLRVFQFPI